MQNFQWDYDMISTRNIFIVLFLLTACSKREPAIKVIGHAGNGMDISSSVYHCNSLEAISLASDLPGLDGIEIDIQLDKTGTLWVYHEDLLEMATDKEGCIALLDSINIIGAKYKSLHHEKLIPLSEVWKVVDTNKLVFLDIKHWIAPTSDFINRNSLYNSLKKQNIHLKKNVRLILAVKYWLDFFSDDFNVVFSSSNWQDIEEVEENAPVSGFVLRNNFASKDQVSTLQQNNFQVFLFDIRSFRGLKEAKRKIPNGILADNTRQAIAIVK